MTSPALQQQFEAERQALTGLAYRMLGSVSDAEDTVQDAWLRWQEAGGKVQVTTPAAFLRTIVTRLCLDRLRAARHLREVYVGPWLPEPLVDADTGDNPERSLAVAQEASMALMLVMEKLTPPERAVFILREAFDTDYADIAEAIGKSEAACRQLAKRARGKVGTGKPALSHSPDDGAIAMAFWQASRSGDVSRLQALLAQDATLYSDGGGKRAAALRPISGREALCDFYAGLVRRFGEGHSIAAPWLRPVTINGLPGFVSVEQDGLPQAMAVQIEGGRIKTIYVVRNPEKLAHLHSLINDQGTAQPIH